MSEEESVSTTAIDEALEESISKILSDCMCALYCPSGKFYPKKDYGSRITASILNKEKYLLAYARSSLADFDGVWVKAVRILQGAIEFDLLINNYERTVMLSDASYI